MSMLKTFKKSAKDNAFQILEGGVKRLEALQTAQAENFTFSVPSAATADFVASSSTITNPTNDKVSKAISVTMDAISTLSQDCQTLEAFLHLHIPKMEDGNNFGVTVQLAMLKQLTEYQTAANTQLEELTKYVASRADALEKLKLPSTSSSVSKSKSTTTTDGKAEEKTSESTEEKKTACDTTSIEYTSRLNALVAVDTLYYFKAKTIFQSSMTTYASILDFMDKNQEKLEKPKGSGGSHSGYSSMY